MSNKVRKMVARGLTASSRGSLLNVPRLGISGLIQSVEWFNKTTVITLTVTIDLENMEVIEVIDG